MSQSQASVLPGIFLLFLFSGGRTLLPSLSSFCLLEEVSLRMGWCLLRCRSVCLLFGGRGSVDLVGSLLAWQRLRALGLRW